MSKLTKNIKQLSRVIYDLTGFLQLLSFQLVKMHQLQRITECIDTE